MIYVYCGDCKDIRAYGGVLFTPDSCPGCGAAWRGLVRLREKAEASAAKAAKEANPGPASIRKTARLRRALDRLMQAAINESWAGVGDCPDNVEVEAVRDKKRAIACVVAIMRELES